MVCRGKGRGRSYVRRLENVVSSETSSRRDGRDPTASVEAAEKENFSGRSGTKSEGISSIGGTPRRNRVQINRRDIRRLRADKGERRRCLGASTRSGGGGRGVKRSS